MDTLINGVALTKQSSVSARLLDGSTGMCASKATKSNPSFEVLATGKLG